MILVPGFLFIKINKLRKTNKLYQTDTLDIYGFLYIDYKTQLFYWEFVKILFRITFSFFMIFLTTF